MSMLAERKQKKGFRLNPQALKNSAWTDDDNKFGQKMLEKYGWAKGEGIGMKGQGISDPIKQNVNFEGKGLGYSGPAETPSFYDGYEAALAALNETYGDGKKSEDAEKPPESLEERSKSAKRRIHYHKFVRAKDVSRYSDKDLQGIFGTKKSVRKTVETKPKKKDSPNNKSPEKSSDEESSNLVTNQKNLKDYFEEKMAKLKGRRNEGILADQTLTEEKNKDLLPDFTFTPQRSDFSFNYSVCEETPKIETEETPIRKKKKSKKNKVLEPVAEEVEENVDEKTLRKLAKKAKKKLLKLSNGDQVEECNSTKSSLNESYVAATTITDLKPNKKRKQIEEEETVIPVENKVKKCKLSTKESFRMLASDVERLCSKVRKTKSSSAIKDENREPKKKKKKSKKDAKSIL